MARTGSFFYDKLVRRIIKERFSLLSSFLAAILYALLLQKRLILFFICIFGKLSLTRDLASAAANK